MIAERIGGLLGKLRRDRRGAAATEFAIWTTSLFFTLMGVMDFAAFYQERGQINEALSAVSVSAFKSRENVNFQSIPGAVQALADNPQLSVSLACNGTANSCVNTGRTCSCLRQDGTYAAISCGTTCTGSNVTANSTGGYYFTITASQSHKPLLLPVTYLGPAAVSQSVTVRLQ